MVIKKMRFRVIGYALIATLIQSCVMYDPWRDESYEAVQSSDETNFQKDSDGTEDSKLIIFVFSSGYENESRSPFGFSIRLPDEKNGIKSVTVNKFNAYLNGIDLGETELHNIHSRSPVTLGTNSVELYPAPCCVFWIATDQIELAHQSGDMLTVNIEFCITVSDKTECHIEERSFSAVVRNGLFQIVPV